MRAATRTRSSRAARIALPTLWILALVVGTSVSLEGMDQSGTSLQQSRDYDRSTRVDANLIDMWVTNHGSFAYDIETGNSGLIYPRGGQNTTMFAAGLWLGGMVGQDLRVSVSEYSFEYGPGAVVGFLEWGDPEASEYRTYKIEGGDGPGDPDYDEWPVDDGAPVDKNGDPLVLGDQTLFSVFNDLNPDLHSNDAGSTNPLNVEVQHTTFALRSTGAEEHIVFMIWKIVNEGIESIDDMYVSAWADPDVGGFQDDFVGCDPARSIGYAYNATNNDNQYGSRPPAVAIQVIQGPIVPAPGQLAYVNGETIPDYANLPMTAFVKYINGTDPSAASESYYQMQGKEADGSPIIDPTNGKETTFMVSGNPLDESGWLDSNPADRRMMVSSGPFDLPPKQSQTVAVAIVAGQGSDRLDSVARMFERVDLAPEIFRSVFGDVVGACCLPGGCEELLGSECSGAFFPGVACSSDPCAAIGACCFPDGTCIVTSDDDCEGEYQGDDSICSSELCPDLGPESACCLPDGTCSVLAESICVGEGGSYLADTSCELSTPGDVRGWGRNDDGNMIIDEVAGPGGVPVAPDGHGGPGEHVWHSFNSTGEWILSAGGGSGDESRFTRGGDDEENLTNADVLLRWDNDPENYGWWAFEDGSSAPIPFGLYLEDPLSGQETRMIPILFAGSGTIGTYEISASTPDGWQGWPATDWCYGFTGDYVAFLQDALDGQVDGSGYEEDELFARLVFASESSQLPAEGTVIRFVTKDDGLFAGSGFDAAVPFAWAEPDGIATCFDPGLYDVYRDGDLIGSTSRLDYLDSDGLVNGTAYEYRVRFRNPITDEVSDLSAPVSATPRLGGFQADAGYAKTPPVLDGVIGEEEWEGATVLDATSMGAAGATLLVMNDGSHLYLALADERSVQDVRVHFDWDASGAYEGATEGRIRCYGTVPSGFVRMAGVYPEAQSMGAMRQVSWAESASGGGQREIKISLEDDLLAGAAGGAAGVVPLYFHSNFGSGQYPQGPPSVLREAPQLFAQVSLAEGSARDDGQRATSLEIEAVARTFPNPFQDSITIRYQVPSSQLVSIELFDVSGKLIRRLVDAEPMAAGSYEATWDGRGDRGAAQPTGIYYSRVRGQSFEWVTEVTKLR